MSESNERRPFVLRFLDVFLQEQNIRWMLCLGLMILLGSSLMLVSSQWTTYSIGWRLGVLLGYTAAVHGLGQLTYHSLGLRKTGTGLMALTVLLLPLTFHGLKWVQPDDELSASSLLDHTILWGSLTSAVALCTLAAKRIFTHFLRKTDWIFLASYVLLCIAAAVVPLLPTALAPITALAIWSVFAIGAASVNQHDFCMIEDHRLPRIFGFFPILLLGTQFLGVFSLSLAEHIAMPWIGLGLVLTSIPVLLAVDALVRVFQRVHGKVTRPYPWSIALPLTAGLALMLIGLVLAANSFPQMHVFVPAAAIEASLLGVIAKRTQQRGYVWAMLVATIMAYQFSPTFFREFALQLAQSGATSLGEQRLPVAFYGLTYLPLLIVLSVWSARGLRRNEPLFAPVMQGFVAVVSVLLLPLALTHTKAMFPVGMSLLACGLLQLKLFQRRSRLALAIAAFVVATLGFVPFLREVLNVPVDAMHSLLVATLSSALLALPGRKLDRITARWLPELDQPVATPLCELTGLLGTIFTSIAWLFLAFNAPVTVISIASGALLAVLLLMQSIRWKDALFSEYAIFFTTAVPTLLTMASGIGLSGTITACLIALGILWLVALSLSQRADSRFVTTLAPAICRQSAVGFGLATALYVWPQALWVLVTTSTEVNWTLSLLTLAWLLGVSLQRRSAFVARLTWASGLLAISNAVIELTLLSPVDVRPWLPAVWALLSIVCLLVKLPQSESLRCLVQTWHAAARFTLGLTAAASLTYLSEPIRMAGLIATVGVLSDGIRRRNKLTHGLGWMSLNWQVCAAVVMWFVPTAQWTLSLSRADFEVAALITALAMTLQAFAWRLASMKQQSLLSAASAPDQSQAKSDSPIELADLIAAQRRLLFVVTGIGLALNILSTSAPLNLVTAAIAGGTYGMLAIDCLLSARCRAVAQRPQAAERLVWLAQLMLALGIGHLVLGNVIVFGSGMSLFATLAYGLAAWAISRASKSSTQWRHLCRPLELTSTVLPAVTVCLGVVRHVSGDATSWLGMNSLALLFAAGIYFWRGLEDRSKGFLITSGIILNVACLLLWNELSWSDPQCFMIPLGLTLLGLIELLRDQLPEAARNPLRYVGSLVILVSPTFHIVSGSWWHLFSLMSLSVLVSLLGMGLHIRAMLYLGTAFLTADLVAMVIRGGVDNPSILWLSGIGLGTAVVALAAYCEQHREQLMQRVRLVAAELEAWQ